MRGYLFFLLVLISLFGCQSPLQTYIAKHATVEKVYGESHRITVVAEDESDLNDSVMTDLLWVQQRINETVLPDDDGLKHITLFLPSTEKSFIEARKCITGAGDSPGVAFTTPASRTVVFRPDTWRDRTREYVVETYIHELMHYVALRIDGDMDADHSKSEYWGNGGLVSIIFREWQEQRELSRQSCRQ